MQANHQSLGMTGHRHIHSDLITALLLSSDGPVKLLQRQRDPSPSIDNCTCSIRAPQSERENEVTQVGQDLARHQGDYAREVG